MDGLNTQKSLKNDQYPKSITAANEVLSNHKFDEKKPGGGKGGKGNDGKKKGNGKESEPDALAFAQLDGKCWVCGKEGHRLHQCPLRRSMPKEKWAINMAHAENNLRVGEKSESEKSQQNSVSWCGMHAAVVSEPELV